MADKLNETLLDALRQLLAGPAEQRLYRSGKLPGVFATRAGTSAEAATKAIADGLLEVIRTETKGKTAIEWVRLTPRGVEYLHANESPIHVLEELRDLLHVSKEGLPLWVLQMKQELSSTSDRLTAQVQRMSQQLDALSERVESALRRTDLTRLPHANGTGPLPWAGDALAYLERRRESGSTPPCSLPELFTALRPQHADLSLPAFLDGLRRLHDHRALQLLPYDDVPEKIPEPEYALADGPALLYYVTR